MLKVLHIENIAVIEKSDIEFGKGFNVMTGETGAGKSIVIDALGAVLGMRMSRDLIRTGEQSAMVTAVFDNASASEWCEENGVDFSENELIIMRRINTEGKNICRVNGCPVTVAQLRALGMQLLDIHGQNDGTKLLDEKNHLKYLDSFGAVNKKNYDEAYASYVDLKKQIDALNTDESEKARRVDMLTYQIDEIERANLKIGEMQELTERRSLMKNSGRLSEAVNNAFTALYGSERSEGAVSLIEEAESAVSSSIKYSDKLSTISSLLSDLRYSAEDVAEQLRDMRADLDFSPNELDEVENRLDLLKRLTRKYGSDEGEVLEFLERSKKELDEIEYSSERMKKLEAELKAIGINSVDDLNEAIKKEKLDISLMVAPSPLKEAIAS